MQLKTHLIITAIVASVTLLSSPSFALQADASSASSAVNLKLSDTPSADAKETASETNGMILQGQVLPSVSSDETSKTKTEDEQSPSELATTDQSSQEQTVAAKFNGQQLAQKRAIERCLSIYYAIQVDADVLRPWSIMHGLIAFGDETLIRTKGRRVSAVEYLCANGVGDDRRLLQVIDGKLSTNVGRGFQGHEGQLLAMLAQADVPPMLPMSVDGHAFTVTDLIKHEMMTCKSGSELTFKLLALSHYIDSDAVWENSAGQQWDFPRLLTEELSSPIDKSTSCGGTHRLMAISRAVVNRQKQQKPVDGAWASAEKYIKDFQKFAFTFQNPDGSFSTQWFHSREFDSDINRRLYTTGHVLEWLVYSSSNEQLRDPRIFRCVDYVVNLMLTAPGYQLDVGPRGHAIHALRMYEARVFGKSDHRQLMTTEFVRQIEEQEKRIRQAAQLPQYLNQGNQPNQIQSQQIPLNNRRRGVFGLRR